MVAPVSGRRQFLTVVENGRRNASRANTFPRPSSLIQEEADFLQGHAIPEQPAVLLTAIRGGRVEPTLISPITPSSAQPHGPLTACWDISTTVSLQLHRTSNVLNSLTRLSSPDLTGSMGLMPWNHSARTFLPFVLNKVRKETSPCLPFYFLPIQCQVEVHTLGPQMRLSPTTLMQCFWPE